jgi:HK97 family phage portal protein
MANPLTQLARILLPPPEEFQQRSIELAASFDDQINVLTRQRTAAAWRGASINEALGVPAIWGAVTLIADTVGSLSLEGFRNEQLLPATDRPRLIIRPNPFTAPYAFFRDTAFYRASRGEFWWWVAARDTDESAMSLYPVPPWEIVVEVNPRNRLRPIIKWAGREMRNEDMRQSVYMPDGLRGKGPLQACGAAISVAVESQTWAANFFGSNIPSLIGETEQDMDPNEMKALKEQWLETEDANLPRFVTNGLKLHTLDINPEQAQLTESRQHSVGDAARMFNVPGALIEYQMGGSSLTYQNQEGIWTDFQRRCLSPHYLEPIEQEISDLLTRATVARFNLKQLLRADPKTRAEVHKSNIESGIYSAEVAAAEEGYAPGNVDYAPVPLPLPAAIPSQLPIQQRSSDGVRCPNCNKLLAEHLTPPYKMVCPRCKTVAENVTQSRVSDELILAISALANREAPQAPQFVMPEQAPPIVNVHVHNEPSKPLRVRTEVQRDQDGLIHIIEREPIIEAG